MTKEKRQSFTEKLWDFLASLKLAIIIFGLIGGTSIIGTVIEQRQGMEKNLEVIAKIFGDAMAPSIYRILEAMGFMDMYHSWWFLLLLVLFAVNLTICSLDRLPSILKIVKSPIKPLAEEHIGSMAIRREVTVKGKPEAVKEKVEAAFKGLRTDLKEEESEDGSLQLYGEKWRWSRLGVYITHLSILVIFAGALIGLYFGFNGYVNIPEGTAYSLAFSRTGPQTQQEYDEQRMLVNIVEQARGDLTRAAERLGVTEPRLNDRLKRLGVIPFGFQVLCEDFEVEFYEPYDMPKEYRSRLTVLDAGQTVKSKWIQVNDPLRYKGITFYQSSYGMLQDLSEMEFHIRVISASGEAESMRLKRGDTFTIPGSGINATVKSFSPSLRIGPTGSAVTYKSDMMNNMAMRVELEQDGQTQRKWIMKRKPSTGVLPSGDRIELLDLWRTQYTGLQVRKDPGVWIVYLGCLIMSIGLYVAFFMSHRRIWILLKPGKGATTVKIGASAHKGRYGLERRIDRIISLLEEGGKK